MNTFFSVDIEATSTNHATGVLLTIGVQPVQWKPGASPVLDNRTFYVRLDQSWWLEEYGWNGDLHDAPTACADTHTWWMTQDALVRSEAWQDETLVRHQPDVAAKMLAEYCTFIQPDYSKRFFVANPVAYDKGFIDGLFGAERVDGPFHYRSLCLRSMKFGMRPGSDWGSDREDHVPEIPHHALSDAIAQAHDLVDMLAERDR